MNVNMNEIINTTIKTNYIPKQQNEKEKFKNILENHESISKNFLTAKGIKNDTEDQELNKTDIQSSDKATQSDDANKTNEKPSKELVGTDKSTEEIPQILDVLQKLTTQVEDVKGDLNLLRNVNKKSKLENKTTVEEKSTVEDETIVNLDDSYDGYKTEAKVINFVEVAINSLKENTGKQSEQSVGTDKSTEKVAQIQQVLQSLGFMLQSVEKASTTENGKNALNDINLEQLVGVDKLAPKAKISLKNSLNEIVDLDKSYDNNKLRAKVINFVEVAIDSLKQNTEKPSDQLVGNDEATEKVEQSQKVLKSLTTILQSAEKASTTVNDKNELDSINLEQLVGVDKLAPDTKNTLNSKLNEIVDLIKKSKANNETLPKILDMMKKLTSQVEDVKGDLSLLKGNEKKTVEGRTTVESKDTNDSYPNNNLETKIIDFVELATNALKQNTEKPSEQLKGNDKATEKVAQIQQVLQSLGFMLQNIEKASTTENGKNGLNDINLEQLVGVDKLTPVAKNILKSSLNDLFNFIEKSKGNNGSSTQITDVIQKLTTEVESSKGDLKLIKVLNFQTFIRNNEDKSIKDNLLIKQSVKTASTSQTQSSSDTRQDNKSSGNKSFEEKFLNNLLSQDKNETKISKVVNFMSQFEAVKTIDTTKVQVSNITINENNFEVDVIKNIKFMETNNIKDLIVKMNPKELGEITIKITMESGSMKASISAQNKDTYNLLNNHVQDISDRLKNMDIKIHSLDINIYEDSTFFSKDSNGKNNNDRQNNSNAKINVEPEDDVTIANNNVIEESWVNKFV